MKRPVLAAVTAVCAVALALSGCDDGGGSTDDRTGREPATATATAEDAADDFGCLTGKQLKRSVTFEDTEGNEVGGYTTGSGATGVVLSHQSNNNVCSWVPAADELAGDGYRVLAVDSSGSEVPELVAAAARLRHEGAKKIILMGASKGGTASLVAAAEIEPEVAAVVSLSGPGFYHGLDATEAVPGLTMPLYLVAARGDGTFGEDAEELHKLAKKSRGGKLRLVPGAAHGNDILTQQPDVWKQVKTFLARQR
ncbi:alpha/beta hydrolase [Streptomyces sp. NPDC086783]|uniref:alpha/beta hydrolase n=1 Tax=Streptomyces sp. NPDC086783 TaxID=3365758 RepID=UPI0038030729